MCGKSPTPSSDVLTEEMDQQQGQGEVPVKSEKTGGIIRKRNADETLEEKLKRRKLERKKRTLAKKQAKGLLVTGPSSKLTKKVVQAFSQKWDAESAFVTQLMQCLPEVRQPGLLMEEEERTDEYISVARPGGRQDDDGQEQKLTKKFFEKVRKNLKSQGVETTAERATSYTELKERLHRRIAELAQKPNLQKREKKQKKKEARMKEEKSNKGKKLISQSAAGASAGGGAVVKDEEPSVVEVEKKTPLKKKPVVKSNGEIVYSKFDFISGSTEQNYSDKDFKTKKGAKKGVTSAEELLKQAEKHEKKVSSLEKIGEKRAAVDLEENKKWEAALRRAEGQKVKDDPLLLKKTIKKMGKQKQVTKKKWKERVERVEKQKEERQQKRKANIQAKKDDRKKRGKKLLRKRGRIA